MIVAREYESVTDMMANYARIARQNKPAKPRAQKRVIRFIAAPDPKAAELSPQGYLRKRCREMSLAYEDMMTLRNRVITAVRQQLMLELYEEFAGISMQRVASIFGVDNATFHHAKKQAEKPNPYGSAIERMKAIRTMFEDGEYYRVIAAATGNGECGISMFIRDMGWQRP